MIDKLRVSLHDYYGLTIIKRYKAVRPQNREANMSVDKIIKKHGLKVEARVALEGNDHVVACIENYLDGNMSNLSVLLGEVIEEGNQQIVNLLDEESVLCSFDARGIMQIVLTSPAHATHNSLAGIVLCEGIADAARRHATQLHFARIPSTRHSTSAFIAATYDLHADHDGKATKATVEAIKPRLISAIKSSNELYDEFAKILPLDEN
jgi:hypothetical protein